jgi:(4S)-4-hydroxy-5-phosphonooxypentane-2,3-dione isomerase
MSAFGPKRTCAGALHMSAFGGKADMPFCTAYVRAFHPKPLNFTKGKAITKKGRKPMFKSFAMTGFAIALGLGAWLLPTQSERATAQSGPLHILVVEYDIVPAEIDNYLKAIKELAAAAVNEPGYRQLSVTVSQKDANHVLLFESWDNKAALDAFLATDRFKRYAAATSNMVANRNIRAFSSVSTHIKGM